MTARRSAIWVQQEHLDLAKSYADLLDVSVGEFIEGVVDDYIGELPELQPLKGVVENLKGE
jgi:hypothetical protein